MSLLSKLRLTIFPNGLGTFLVDSNAIEKTANYTVITNDDSGKQFISKLDGIVFALGTAADFGNTITFVNVAEDGKAELNISPEALDSIDYVSSAVVNKDIINTKATSKKGDYVTLASMDGAGSWQVVAVRGIWAKEA